jgi:hypothetical protein
MVEGAVRCIAPLVILLATAAVGCAAVPEAPKQPAASSVPAAQVKAVIDDATHRSGIPAAKFVVKRAETVTWLDGSLGCPDPDAFYTQALVPGYRIQLEAGGQAFDYHTDQHGTLVLCPVGRAVPPANPLGAH